MMAQQYQPVTPVDLYDFYGIASLNRDDLMPSEMLLVMERLRGLKKLFLNALHKRFQGWLGESFELTVRDIIDVMKGSLEESVEEQIDQMAMMGQSFNMMAAVRKMRGEDDDGKAALKKREELMIRAFSDNLANFQAADYPKIAQGMVNLWEAEEAKDIILAIDFLNDLQHCGGYILIDFVAGRRDPSNEFGNKICHEILDIKSEVKSPMELIDEMSEEIQELVRSQWG